MTMPLPNAFFDHQHFTFNQLNYILPVGQTAPAGDLNVTLLSLECYRAGFLAVVLIEQERALTEIPAGPNSDERPHLLAGLLAIRSAEDDGGRRYKSALRSGAGGGNPDQRVESHNTYGFAPSLAWDTRTLTLTFELVERAGMTTTASPPGAPTTCWLAQGRSRSRSLSGRHQIQNATTDEPAL